MSATMLSKKLVGKVRAQTGFGDAQLFSQAHKLESIQKQLNGDSTSQKLEGMKKLVAMLSKGKDVSLMFPHVVKLIVNTSLDIKKLVYMFLIHYAEQKPDEALLSISHFQKDMTDKNQFIRAMALRVLSSIRVPLIVQIVVIAIRKCAADSSPYVRKAAALAVPKIVSLSSDEEEVLVGVIVTLMQDSNPLVLGAAIFAFNEVCALNFSLVHTHFRKLCRLLTDCDEWGQICILTLLTRYARTQFLSPFQEGYKKKQVFYGQDDEKSDDEAMEVDYDMDSDHRLLLRSALPLLQSRNLAVVMAVASLYFHVAPPLEFGKVAKSLVRILRTSREQRYVVLLNMQTMAAAYPSVFETYLQDFYVSAADPVIVRLLKLNMMAMLASSSNSAAVLKEFKTYLKHHDPIFLTDTIKAAGRIAIAIPEIREQVIHVLMGMIDGSQEVVAAESVNMLRQLLQRNPKSHARIISHLGRMLNTLKAPVARAAVTWLIGETFAELPNVQKLAPDAFRQLVKGFAEEDPIVKNQIITFGTKLYLAESLTVGTADLKKKLGDMYYYMLQVARFDPSYDIRDRARMLRNIVGAAKTTEVSFAVTDGPYSTSARQFLRTTKVHPKVATCPHEQSKYHLGSMTHALNHLAAGYLPLPDFPTVQPDPSSRDVASKEFNRDASRYSSSSSSDSDDSRNRRNKKSSRSNKASNNRRGGDDLAGFYSDDSRSDRSLSDRSRSPSVDSRDRGRRATRRRSFSSESDRSRSRSASNGRANKKQQGRGRSLSRSDSDRSRSRSYSRSRTPSSRGKRYDSLSRSRSRSDSDEGDRRRSRSPPRAREAAKGGKSANDSDRRTGADGLEMLDFADSATESMSGLAVSSKTPQRRQTLVNKTLRVEYSPSNASSLYGPETKRYDMFFSNTSPQPINQIHIGKEDLKGGVSIVAFSPLDLDAGEQKTASLHIAWGTSQSPPAVSFEIWTSAGNFRVDIDSPAVAALKDLDM